VIWPRGGGARNVMKFAKASTPLPSSFKSFIGLQDSESQSPPGQLSSGNSGLVIPISFKYASPENWKSEGFWHFQPNLPTAFFPVAIFVTIDTLPLMWSG